MTIRMSSPGGDMVPARPRVPGREEENALLDYFDRLDEVLSDPAENHLSVLLDLECRGYVGDVSFSPCVRDDMGPWLMLDVYIRGGPYLGDSVIRRRGRGRYMPEAMIQCAEFAYEDFRAICLGVWWQRVHPPQLPAPMTTSERLGHNSGAEDHLELVYCLCDMELHTTGVPKITFVAIDLETSRRSEGMILEVGISTRKAWVWPRVTNSVHFIVREGLDFSNGRHADKKFGFQYGQSEVVALADLPGRIMDHISLAYADCDDVILVGHNLDRDVAWFKNVGIAMDNTAVTGGYLRGTQVCDVAKVEQALKPPHRRPRLDMLAATYNVAERDWDGWHNAGNDARMVLEVLRKQKDELA
ncbi:hypothetical protein CLCR_04129 [Cladophialophora carrionii]|uniref:Gfd2/YDR514C-like C-terminal domain-containing protein n=1 Tax=Cladophialophora carrionii TaxID=86049 RepID=A0A1C1CJ56_9EURO|nr:hypothetical protein CLCR_04129 [Cladophialophora carrionii]